MNVFLSGIYRLDGSPIAVSMLRIVSISKIEIKQSNGARALASYKKVLLICLDNGTEEGEHVYVDPLNPCHWPAVISPMSVLEQMAKEIKEEHLKGVENV